MATYVLWLCLLPLVASSALEDAANTFGRPAPYSGMFSFQILLEAKYLLTV
jgi:hypothetical protein